MNKLRVAARVLRFIGKTVRWSVAGPRRVLFFTAPLLSALCILIWKWKAVSVLGGLLALVAVLSYFLRDRLRIRT